MPEETDKPVTAVAVVKTPEEIERWNRSAQELGLPSMDAIQVLKKFAEQMAGSIFLPAEIGSHPANILGVILRGREMGLQPMESLGLFWVEPKSKRLCMYADAMMAVMRRASFTFPVKEFTNLRAYLKAVRPDGEEHEAEFTIEDARRAELTGKDNWRKYPKAMMKARVIGEIWRVLAVDKGGGQIYTREEMEDLNTRGGGAAETIEAEVVDYPVGRRSKDIVSTDNSDAAFAAQGRSNSAAASSDPPSTSEQPSPDPAPPENKGGGEAVVPEESKPAPETPAAAATPAPEPPAKTRAKKAPKADAPAPAAPAAPPAQPNEDVGKRYTKLEVDMGINLAAARARLKGFVRGWFGLDANAPIDRNLPMGEPLPYLEAKLKENPKFLDSPDKSPAQLGAEAKSGIDASKPDALDEYGAAVQWPDTLVAAAKAAAKTRRMTPAEMVEWCKELDLPQHDQADILAFFECAAVGPECDAYLLFDLFELGGKNPASVVAALKQVSGKTLAEVGSAEVTNALKSLVDQAQPEDKSLFS